MQKVTLIENELVPIYKTSTGEKVVYGTELYEVLGVRSNYRDWVRNRLNDCEATENEDFQIFAKFLAKGRPSQEHIIKLDTAKEMAMLERNEKGKRVRRYFIEFEKKYKKQVEKNVKPLSALEQLQLQSRAIFEVNGKIDEVKQELDDFKQDMPLLAVECDKITTAVHKRGVDCLGGKESNAYKDSSLRGKVYQDIYREIKRQFGVSTYKAIKRNQCDLAIGVIEKYELPIILLEQINDCNAQMNMGVA